MSGGLGSFDANGEWSRTASYFITFNLPSYSFWTTFAARAWSTTSAPSTRRSKEVWYCYRSARTACAVVARLRRCRRAVASQLCPGTVTYADAAMGRGLLVLLLPRGGRRRAGDVEARSLVVSPPSAGSRDLGSALYASETTHCDVLAPLPVVASGAVATNKTSGRSVLP